ncbi:MAG: tetratricopeptide repeat protein [Burkholderiaceae bacterium]|nr:tetratricopeptide repeat protein [Burkholderiaceae bacterium]
MKHRFLVATALALAFSGGCALAQPAVSAVTMTDTPPPLPASGSSELHDKVATAQLMYELLLGEFSFAKGDAASAHRFMLDAARRTNDEALYRRATEMAIQSRASTAALTAVRAWRLAWPDSVAANRSELQVLLALGRIPETQATLQAVLRTMPKTEQTAFMAALPLLYASAQDKNQAAQIVEHVLDDARKDPQTAAAAWTAIGRMRLQAGNQTGAYSAAVLGQIAESDAEWPALLALQLLEEGLPRAEALVLRHLTGKSPSSDVQLGYARLLAEQNRFKQAHQQLGLLLQRDASQAGAWLMQGLLYEQQGDAERAERALSRFLVKFPADEENRASLARADAARIALARIAENKGQFARADKLLQEIESPGNVFGAHMQRATLLARQGHIDEALALLDDIEEYQPGDARLKLQAKAQLLRDNGREQQSYDLLKAALERNPGDQDLKYDLAMVAEKLGRPAEMETLLRQIIAQNGDAHNALNALGYTLADRGEKLDEARALIERAVQIDPDNAYIQDSLGWLEYRQGNQQEALRILEGAWRKSQDPEISAHYGELLWLSGQQQRAREVWREGLRLDPQNKVLEETLQRLKAAL